MPDPVWHDLGPADALRDPPLRQLLLDKTKIALVHKDGQFSALDHTADF